jgi:hypothetical protein
MRDTLRALRAIHLAPVRTAHAWFDGEPGSSGGTAVADPPAAAGEAGPPADPPAGATPKDDGLTPSEKSKIGRLERELEKMRKAEEERQNASLSEVERLKKELAAKDAAIEAASAQAKAGRLSGASLAAAARLGFADPEDAQRFLDTDKVDWSDDGTPTNVADLLEAVLKRKPYLKASFTQPPDLGQGTRGRAGIPLTRDAIAKMTPAEINARWPEVQEVMSRG